MSSIIIAGAIVLSIVLIILALVAINNHHRKKMAMELTSRFTELGERNNLSFTHKEMMQHFIIGLDELRRKLFVLKRTGNKYDFEVIDLRQVKSCSTKKIHNSINMGTVTKERYENHIDKVVLAFNYTDNRPPTNIPFFESGENHLLEISELEQKAASWVTIITKTINNKLKQAG